MCSRAISLAFVTNGGAGTLFIQANFIYCVSRYLQDEPVKIIVFAHKSKALNDAVFARQDFLDAYYGASERHRALSGYDVAINLNFYPEILSLQEENLGTCPRLLRLLKGWRSFLEDDAERSFYASHFGLDINGQIRAIIQGKNCLNILDVTGELGLSRDYAMKLALNKSERKTLKRWGLQPSEYITIQRGAYPTLNVREVPKIWPVSHYEELARLLKKCFPGKKIVQLGESKERCREIRGIDLSLIGETDWEDLKVLLKNAWLHIDGECGMVHLRKVLHGGPSVVLFGPTSIDFYGYDGNINIASDACPHWCCKLLPSSDEKCLLQTHEYNRCMVSIRPNQVMDRIMEWAYMEMICGNHETNSECLLKESETLGVALNPYFANDFFRGRKIYYSEIRHILLSKLQVQFSVDGIPRRMQITQSPAYQLLKGNHKGYQSLMDSEESICRVEHNEQRFWELYSSMQEGYDERYKIVVSPEYRIYDGHHRASILAWKEGIEHEIDALVVYSVLMFPFYKIRRGSKIIIYGFGSIGQIYARQVILSNYASLERIIDRHADRLHGLGERYGIQFESPEKFFHHPKHYDYIVLALGNPRNIEEVKSSLLYHGIPEEKIIAHDGRVFI